MISAKVKVRIASMIGNVLEWYDFAIYGYFAAVLGKLFFPSDDPTASILAAFGVFAIGFIARPIGSVLFGNLGDCIGRRRVLIVSVLVMAVPTTLVGLLPTYAQIGVWAPAFLIALRLLQGLSTGGELTGSITFMIEGALQNKRGLAGSWTYVGAGVGILLGSAVGSLITTLLDQPSIDTWGWRIPFLFGPVIAICGYLIRRYSLKDEAYRSATSRVNWSMEPLRHAVTTYRRQMVQAFGIAAYFAGGFYLIFIYLTTYLSRVVRDPAATAFDINTINMVVYIIMLIVGGLAGDRFGFRRVLLALAVSGLLLAVPLFWLIDHPNALVSFAGQFGFALLLGPYGGLFATTMAYLFPPQVRMSGFSVSYNIAYAALGGTTPLVASYLIGRSAGDLSPAYVLMVCATISVATIGWAWRDLQQKTDQH